MRKDGNMLKMFVWTRSTPVTPLIQCQIIEVVARYGWDGFLKLKDNVKVTRALRLVIRSKFKVMGQGL